MKKLAFVFALGMFTMGTLAAQSQQLTRLNTNRPERKEREPKTAEERAEHQTKALTQKLNLSVEQAAKVKEITLARANQMDALKSKYSDSRKGMGMEAKSVKETWENQLKGILTPEQFAIYEKNREEKVEERKEAFKARRNG